jgi:hypothetical protein
VSRDLILGVAEGMKAHEIEPFVASLRQTGFDGDLVLLVADLESDALKLLSSAGARLLRVPRLQAYHARLHSLHAVYPRVIRWASSIARDPTRTAARLAASISVRDVRRFFVYYRYLCECRPAYANVMLSDVRDVVFQSNPFEREIGDELLCFLEDERLTLGTERHNRKWLQTAFGDTVAMELAAEPIVCAGVTIGPRAAMLDYLKVMVTFLLGLRAQRIGLDQAVHNYVLHRRLVPHARLVPNGQGLVATLGLVPAEAVGALVDGAAVLHQYDRHPALQAALVRRFAPA